MKPFGAEDLEPSPKVHYLRRVISVLISLTSLGMIAVALFAHDLGIDADDSWGFSRKVLLLVGIVGLIASERKTIIRVVGIVAMGLQGVTEKARCFISNQPFVQHIHRAFSESSYRMAARVRRFQLYQVVTQNLSRSAKIMYVSIRTGIPGRWILGTRVRRAYSISVLAGIPVILFYLWLVSTGFGEPWPSTTDYYDRLATAFLHGQVNLIDQPNEELLQVDDPYDFEQRGSIPYLWDTSFYNGKFYLYWGPSPALVLIPIKLFTTAEIGDDHLTFGFISGTFIFSTLLLLRLWKESDQVPLWTIVPVVFAAGLVNPIPWLLSRPAVYEAAISSGQFFLLAGIFFNTISFREKGISTPLVCLTSCCWALAIGSRATLLPAILLFVFVNVLVIGHSQRSRQQRTYPMTYLLALSIPLLVGISVLCWYNYIRFGNILDFGHRYQLTGMNLNRIYSQILSVSNVVPNAYNYLLTPMRRLEVFPYVKATWGGQFVLPWLGVANEFYYSEQVTGILRSSPYLLLALLPTIYYGAYIREQHRKGGNYREIVLKTVSNSLWLKTLTMSVAVVFLFFPILLFIVCTMRYLADVIPLLTIISGVGFWIGYEHLHNHPSIRKLFTFLVIGLTAFSVSIGMLLAITGYEARFEHLNPVLFEKLTRFFTP